MTPDVVYDQLIGDGLRAQARLLVGRQPRRRLAAPPPRRRRARLAGAARARGALARRHGGGVRRRARPTCRSAVLRGYAGTDLPGHTHGRRWIDVPVHRRAAGGGAGAAARRRHRPRPAGRPRRATCSCGGSRGVQKEAVLASARSLVTVEEIVDELEPRPGAVILPGLGRDRGRGRAGRRAPVLRARLLRPRQRVLPRAGTRSAATASVPSGSPARARDRDVEQYRRAWREAAPR